ncbi:hypothetical protein CSC94_04730 [Zhengella mangrovi]|uniref:SPOR domain-containing protein n=1 Tax=Zhengella mangrovi TaxID=1982044 RepID=A0A2G1QR70_9HYPH|nr:SPOR domain-containing protein [Zhengella mangrovi]PHP67981.1 hypothetical protein CSC94_04730 [Zhengella mangrovi]
MANTKSAKLDLDLGLSPDDPLSKLANIFDVSDNPWPAEQADMPSIDMEQELLPMTSEGQAEQPGPVEQAGSSWIGWSLPGSQTEAEPAPVTGLDAGQDQTAAFEPAAEAEQPQAAADELLTDFEFDVPAETVETAPAVQQQAEPAVGADDDEPVAALDDIFSDLDWSREAAAVEAPAEPVSAWDAVPDHDEPAGSAVEAEAAYEPELPQPETVAPFEPAETVEPEAVATADGDAGPVEDSAPAAVDMPFVFEPAGETVTEPDPAEAMAEDQQWSESTVAPVDDSASWPSGAGEWNDAADAEPEQPGEAAPAFQEQPGFATYQKAGWQPEETVADHEAETGFDEEAAVEHPDIVEPVASAPEAADAGMSFADNSFEDELEALLAGGPAEVQPQPPVDAAEPAYDRIDDTPAHEEHGAAPSAREEMQPRFAYSNFREIRPQAVEPQPERAPVEDEPVARAWSQEPSPEDAPATAADHAGSIDLDDGQAPADGYGMPDIAFDEVAFTQPAEALPDAFAQADVTEEPAAETADTGDFLDLDVESAFEQALFAASKESGADQVPEIPASIEEAPLRSFSETGPEEELPEFDESAFLDQSFVDEDFGLADQSMTPVEEPSMANQSTEVEFDLDPALIAGLEAAALDDGGHAETDTGAMAPDTTPGQPSRGGGAMAAAAAAGAVGGFVSRFGFGRKDKAPEPAADMPEINTVDVPEAGIVVADDLDLPEMDFGGDDTMQAADAGLNDLLGDDFQTEVATQAAPADQSIDFESYFERELQDAGISFDRPAPGQPSAQGAPQAPRQVPSDSYAMTDAYAEETSLGAGAPAYDEELERDLAFDQLGNFGEDEQEAPRSKRGLLIAGIVAGIALIGGIGAFALSGGGGSGPAREIVRADPEPVKVKPENPGGTKVPNQERVVYEEVAGKPVDGAPQQETLVSKSETPMDVKSKPVRVVAPGPGQDAASVETAAPAPAATGKAEDRISPAETAEEPGPSKELAAVAPRRVRTYVVKPDGTLVAKEAPEAAPAQAETPAAAEPAPAAETAPQTGEAGSNAGVAASVPVPAPRPEIIETAVEEAPRASAPERTAAAADNGLTARQVRTTTIHRDQAAPPVVPNRPADQPVNIVGTTRRDGQQQANAEPAAPAATATANPAAWVQIASQPSREQAQTSYRNLSQRYSGIIGGRGVNIVPADIPGRGTFYRVNIPAGSFTEAANLCRQIKAAGGDCLAKR